MKIYWSAFLSFSLLLALVGCGTEQFGTTPQEKAEKPNPVTGFQQASCTGHTLEKPAVDILYIVDNSASNTYVSQDIRTAIQNTINSISTEFDYRVIGTPLLKTSQGNEDYQILSRSRLPSTIPSSKVVTSSTQFSFFNNVVNDVNVVEAGLGRAQNFISNHQTDLFRQGAYLFIVLVSNGRDTEVEKPDPAYGASADAPTVQITTEFNKRKAEFAEIKKYLKSQQLRLFSVTANTRCKSGYISSPLSYAAMSQALYDTHGFGYKSSADHYDLCQPTSAGQIFADVNANIKQIIVPHTYKYWPITFSETATGLNTSEIKVYKSSPLQAPTLIPSSHWTYISNTNNTTYQSRVKPNVGEPINNRHLIEFTSGNEVTYPECIQVTSVSNLEYFGYVVIPKDPKPESVVLKINGRQIPPSTTDGWSLIGEQTRNIKIAHDGFSNKPEVVRNGYMLQLNGSNNYYKSGDSVEINYIPLSK